MIQPTNISRRKKLLSPRITYTAPGVRGVTDVDSNKRRRITSQNDLRAILVVRAGTDAITEIASCTLSSSPIQLNNPQIGDQFQLPLTDSSDQQMVTINSFSQLSGDGLEAIKISDSQAWLGELSGAVDGTTITSQNIGCWQLQRSYKIVQQCDGSVTSNTANSIFVVSGTNDAFGIDVGPTGSNKSLYLQGSNNQLIFDTNYTAGSGTTLSATINRTSANLTLSLNGQKIEDDNFINTSASLTVSGVIP